MNWHVDYDSIARTYDRRYERNQYAGVQHALLEFVRSNLELEVLEVGCGTGHWLEILNVHGMQLTGLDASAQMLARAKARLPGIKFIRGRAERLPWPAESFDMVFCVNALHHFADKLAFLAEARRILRPGGMMLTVGLDPHSGVDHWYIYDYFERSAEIDKQRYLASSSIRESMKMVGFQDCETQEVEHLIARIPASEAVKRGQLDKTSTSQLGVLTDEEYQRGIMRIGEEIERAENRGRTLFLTTNLRLYGTSGSVKRTLQ